MSEGVMEGILKKSYVKSEQHKFVILFVFGVYVVDSSNRSVTPGLLYFGNKLLIPQNLGNHKIGCAKSKQIHPSSDITYLPSIILEISAHLLPTNFLAS